ncbi:hypothetical protein BT96DRAFT_934899 [Gymnopus androsaceus JB14]|uniref:Uncharacterized protein n=1 Tax=Gymnopus androsaceus JB14 TaxID=1447944 RepID=A0A6A4I7P4_9AGAR|nr:hypothetical protein BT96DRAFT_934899 [Gymnopus androsaceus JB14]
MESNTSAPRTLRINLGDKEKEKDNTPGGKEKGNHGGEEKGVKTSRTTRYKDKFTALRDKYEHVVALQQTYHRDLDTANAKMKKMQEEIDLLLEALMPTTPPPPSVYMERSAEREVYYDRAHGMEVDMDSQRDQVSIPMQLVPRDQSTQHDNSRSRHPQTNGKTNGNTANRSRRYSMEPEQELNPNYLPREGGGRIPIS